MDYGVASAAPRGSAIELETEDAEPVIQDRRPHVDQSRKPLRIRLLEIVGRFNQVDRM